MNIYKGLSHYYQGLGASVTCHGPWIVEQGRRGAPHSGCRIRGLDGLVGLSSVPIIATNDWPQLTVHTVHLYTALYTVFTPNGAGVAEDTLLTL